MCNATCRCSTLQLFGLGLEKSYSAWHIVIPSATHRRRVQPRDSYAATYSKRRSISYIGDRRVHLSPLHHGAMMVAIRSEGIGGSGPGIWGGVGGAVNL